MICFMLSVLKKEPCLVSFFFFNDTATTEIYTLSLHDALPISSGCEWPRAVTPIPLAKSMNERSEEHTSELQSRLHLVCRLLLEKKKKTRLRRLRDEEQEREACVHNIRHSCIVDRNG